jgi:hypothetical protein
MTPCSRCVEALRRAGAHPSEMSRLHQVIMQVGGGRERTDTRQLRFFLPAFNRFFSNSDEPNPRKSLQHKAVSHATGSPFVDKSVHPRHSVAFRVRRFALVVLVYMYARVDAAVKAAEFRCSHTPGRTIFWLRTVPIWLLLLSRLV